MSSPACATRSDPKETPFPVAAAAAATWLLMALTSD